MEYLSIVISSLISLAALFMFTKLIGNRQMYQVSMFDYVSSITLGSIAGELAVQSTESILKPLLSMAVFSIIAFIISYITCKSIVLRRFFEGKAILLYQDGQIYEKNLLKAKLDIDEFLSLCRINGYFDLSEVHTVYLEANGNLSVLPLSKHRPATPDDHGLNPVQSNPLPNIIIDGKIMHYNLKLTGKDEKWLHNRLKAAGYKDMSEIILATYDASKDKINVYKKYHKKDLRDIFE
ncbi:MAG: DUF421 domain-containing protein [Clostridiales bacterium]|nr:DUF421 domain-containing protein [Clostridiales bacterium]